MPILLTVLIPVYNWDVSPLLLRIIEEADAFDLWGRVEVVLLDDGSHDRDVAARNKEFCTKHRRPCLEYMELESNAGRSAVRNMLAAKARGTFLLFLDCDVLPDSDRFLCEYLKQAESDAFDVVCGGVSYRTRVLNDPAYDYHAYLGNKKEVKPAQERNREPWRHILTSNIMVRKSVFQATPFDVRFTGYGYEDIEWGARLAEKFKILHVDNTASHLGLVTKARTYEKMVNSVSNYLLLKSLRPAAFHASSISKLVRLLLSVPASLLSSVDRFLKNLFLSSGNNRLAFLFFQLDFAVLLARAIKERQCDLSAPKPAQGGKR